MQRRILRGLLYINLTLTGVFAVIATQEPRYALMCATGLFCSAVAASELRWGHD